ncbi:MAG: hypothetical protein QM731_02295 [Chitinophagaceae bacterium]
MQQHIQTLVKHIFRKEDLKDVSVNELEQFTASYPYAAIGQFLLARKLKETGGEQEFTHQADKASLYFNNPLWAHWQLQDHAAAAKATPEKVVAAVQEVPAPVYTQPEPVISVVSLAEEAVEQHEAVTEPEEEAVTTTVETEPEVVVTEPVEESNIATEAFADDHNTTIEETVIAEEEDTTEEAPTAEYTDTVTTPIPEPEEEPEELTEEEPDAGPELDLSGVLGATIQPAENTKEEKEEIITEEAPLHATGTPMQTVAAGEDDLFEPYHTIDYFASQGIKLSKEDIDIVKGKLDRQLKSFTEWLRSMKRIAPVTVAAERELDDTTNQSIVKIAEYSVSGNEIVTEAMAEVWAKQGNLPRAIAIYEKLSLLNPTKNAYFAARIQQVISQKPD